MRRHLACLLACLLSSLTLRPASAGIREEVLLAGAVEPEALAAAVLGRGITVAGGECAASLTGPWGEIVWKQMRDVIDPHGFRHFFFRQALEPAPELAAKLPEGIVKDGIPLPDTSIGVHLSKDGTLVLAAGHQVRSAQLANRLVIAAPRDAAYAALSEVLATGAYEPFEPMALDPGARLTWEESAELIITWSGESDELRLAWRVTVPGLDGPGRIPLIDAQTGILVTFQEVIASSTCSPDQSTPVSGMAYPQWLSTFTRVVPATAMNTPQPPFYFEAHWPYESPSYPPLHTFSTATDPNCPWSGSGYYQLIKVGQSGSSPLYGEPSGFTVQREAGAAMFYSRRAFELTGSLGWPGFKGSASSSEPARVAVGKVDSGLTAGGAFLYSDTPGWGPADMVLFGQAAPTSQGNCDVPTPAHACPPPTVCMDLVAHEWGHGIAKYSAGPTTYGNPTVAGQLHEGFADVIGHLVSRSNQADTPAVNWILFEDCVPPQQTIWPCRPFHQRRADQYLTNPPLCYYKTQPLLQSCPPGTASACPYVLQGGAPANIVENHQAGHMLSVGFYLLADGGTTHKNPACGFGAPSSICNVLVPWLGLTKARRIFFDTLVWWIGPTTTWEQLPLFAVSAAFSAFSNCPWSNALTEQDATAKAFGAIGYPTSARMNCP